MEFVQTVIGFVGALLILVSVHEFGHYYVARRCGVKVLRFCIGMGKPFWSVRDKHGTEFGLAPFPLGGYVKMLDEREGNVPDDQLKYAYNQKPVWQRIAILAAGPFANFLLAFVVFSVLVAAQGEVGAAPVLGHVESESIGANAGLSKGQQIRSVDGVPTPSRQAVLERLLMRLGETGVMEMTVSEVGSDMTFELDVSLDQWLRSAQDPNPLKGLGIEFFYPAITVAQVVEGSPAANAGFKIGDKILGIDGQPALTLRNWVQYVQSRANQPVLVELERDSDIIELPVTPKSIINDEGVQVGQVGVQITYDQWPDEMIHRHTFGIFESLLHGAQKTWDTSSFVLVSMKKLVLGEISTKNLSGPIGIAKVAGDRAKAGFVYFVEFLALLSISLGVLNLLPIPILDGGHILYCVIESIKGSPVSEKIQMMGYSAGLAMLACVMVLALYNDILRL